jgi:SAM-dependent methyltransferase
MSIARRIVRAVGYKIVRASEWGLPADLLDLSGDRDVEWAWVAGSLPDRPGRVLDLGPATAFTPLIAALRGGEVLALDLDPPTVPFAHPNLRYVKGDVVNGGLPPGPFDTIINCSTTEHIGLAGRYGSVELPDGDIAAMKLLREHMAGADARMIFTIPVGRDRVAAPYHRIYGHERLPRILAGYRVAKEAYFAKTERNNAWRPAPRDVALAIEGSESFYALGLFVLAPQ